MPKINTRTLVPILVAVIALAAVARTVDTLRVSIPPTGYQPEYRQLAECSGVFMAASVESQDDTEMTETFAQAGSLSLTLARETAPKTVDENSINQLGFDTMTELLLYAERNPVAGHAGISDSLGRCIQLLKSIPTPLERI